MAKKQLSGGGGSGLNSSVQTIVHGESEAKDKSEPDIENWAGKPDSKIYEQCVKFYPQIVKAFENRQEADDAITEYWGIYNAEPDENQMYVGNSKCYIPAVRDAISARAKRALKQLF